MDTIWHPLGGSFLSLQPIVHSRAGHPLLYSNTHMKNKAYLNGSTGTGAPQSSGALQSTRSITDLVDAIGSFLALDDGTMATRVAIARSLRPALRIGLDMKRPDFVSAPLVELGLSADAIKGDRMTVEDDEYEWQEILSCYEQIKAQLRASDESTLGSH